MSDVTTSFPSRLREGLGEGMSSSTNQHALPQPLPQAGGEKRWTRDEIASLFDLPFTELVFRAAEVHRAHHAANEVQLSTLLSI